MRWTTFNNNIKLIIEKNHLYFETEYEEAWKSIVKFKRKSIKHGKWLKDKREHEEAM